MNSLIIYQIDKKNQQQLLNIIMYDLPVNGIK